MKMDYKTYLFFVLATTSYTAAVKVNMRGSLTLGKEVMESVNHYIQHNLSGRRSFPDDADIKLLIIKSAYLCRDLELCNGLLETFVNDYAMYLSKAIEVVYQTVRPGENLFFELEFKAILNEIKGLLRNTSLKINESNHWLMWIELIKKISAIIEQRAIVLTAERLEGSRDNSGIKEELNRKYVTAIAIVEGKFEVKLCVEHDICVKSVECTKALDNLFSILKNLEESKVKLFIRAVSESLAETKFNTFLSDSTMTELQIVLTDMVYSEEVPAKEVLASVHQSVLERLSGVSAKKYTVTGRDVILLNAILSNLDLAYSFRTMDPFHTFFSGFFGWVRTGMKLNAVIRQVMNDITEQLTLLPDEVMEKLKNEVRAFLEITVDLEN